MSKSFEINVHNRYTNKKEIEKIYGDSFVRFAYDSLLGKMLGKIISSRALSRLYGLTQDTNFSGRKTEKFIHDFSIEIDDYEPGSLKDENIKKSYKTFNEFFIRKFKENLRPFVPKGNQLAAFAEARYFGHPAVNDELKLPVKGKYIKALDLIGDKELAADFVGGPFLIARLCPVDYHRYHYPDSGVTKKSFTIQGEFHSVNPLALNLKQDILINNERRVSILETKNFGKLAYIEVGATCVGKIIQSFNEDEPFEKGDEKGYFLFGGSTVIVCGEPGRWLPSADILKNTAQGIETYLHLGDEVGISVES